MAQTEQDVLEDINNDPGSDNGQIVETEEGSEVTLDKDGGAIIRLADEKDTKEEREFYANLAEDLADDELSSIATDLLRKLDEDKKAREERDKKYAEGLRRTGLGDDSPGGASFEGASRVVHPLLVEVAVDFAARSVKELFPPSGPAKDYIPGTVTGPRVEKAKRKCKWLNYQATVQMPEFRSELEQLLTQLPMGGAQYLKLRYNERLKRPIAEFVPIDDVYVPFSAANFYTAERKTHVQTMTKMEFEARVRSGMYRDVDMAGAQILEETAAERANAKIEGKQDAGWNIDAERVVFEIDCQYLITDPERDVSGAESDAADDKGPAPYLITIDQTTQKVVSIYRNWDKDDKAEEALVHMVEFIFVPWRGAQGIGIPHMMGGIAAAATGALRALLDSAHLNNFPGGIKMKAGPMGGQNVRVQASEINEIDGAAGLIDDVRKLYMPIPINQPSPTLMELLGFLVDAGKDVIKTTLDENNDTANTPVGTQMARIEQGMVVFSAIHARLHNAMGKLLQVLARINATWLDDNEVEEETGEQMVFKDDFNGPQDVIPVSDPNIFSEVQRFAQIQTIAQRAQLYPQLYDVHAVEEAILERMKVPDPKKFLVPKSDPVQMNAVNENIAMSLGKAVVAFPQQNQLAHIQTHCDFATSPFFGQNTAIAATFIPSFIKHLTEHLLFWYGTQVHAVGTQATGRDISELMNTKDPETDQMYDEMLANAAKTVIMHAPMALGGIPPVIQQAQQLMHQLMPPNAQDQSGAAQAQASIQKAHIDADVTAQTNQSKERMQQAQIQADTQKAQLDNQTKAQIASETNKTNLQKVQLSDATKLQATQMDNQTAQGIKAAEITAQEHQQQAQQVHEQQQTAQQQAHDSQMATQQQAHDSQQSQMQQDHERLTQAADQQHAQATQQADHKQESFIHQSNVSDGEAVGKRSPG